MSFHKVVETEKVTFFRGSRLKEYVQALPQRPDDVEVTDIGRVLKDLKGKGS